MLLVGNNIFPPKINGVLTCLICNISEVLFKSDVKFWSNHSYANVDACPPSSNQLLCYSIKNVIGYDFQVKEIFESGVF